MTKPALLLIHGLGASAYYFDVLFGPSAAQQEILRCELSTPVGSGTEMFESMVQNLASQLNERSVENIHVLSHSMGCLVALKLSQYFTGNILSHVLLGPVLDLPQANRNALIERAKLARTNGLQDIAKQTALAGVSEVSRITNPLSGMLVESLVLGQDVEHFSLQCEALAKASAPTSESLDSPALFITGTEDKLAPPTLVKKISHHAQQPRQLKIIKDIGHWTHIEAYDECSKNIRSFYQTYFSGGNYGT